jgi:hypothetical protein
VLNRSRLLMGATALLYLGPLLAGLGGFGWAVVPVFATIFMLWLVIMLPQDFPQSLADWQRPEALIAFATRGAVQLLLVLVCFGVGRGIGGALGSLPPFPIMLPIAISFLAIPLARMILNPWKTRETDQLLNDALAQIESGIGSDRAYAEAVLAPLNGLPDAVSEAELESHFDALRTLVDEAVTFDILMDRVTKGEASHAGKCALMVQASDGMALERMVMDEVPAKAMQALRGEAALIGRMAERLVHALRQDPELWGDYPSPAFLNALRVDVPEASEALAALDAEIAAQAPRG